MYDLEIALAVNIQNDRYAKRLADFKKHGLMNLGNVKVALKLLAGTNKIEPSWTGNIDVEVISSESDHPATKICHYYSQINPNHAKWFIKVDDDSATDVSGLFNILNKWFNYEEKHYLIGNIDNGEYQVETTLLKEMGLDESNIYHEIEIAVLSQALVKSITDNELSKNYLLSRSKINDGPKNKSLAVAAKLCQSYPTQVHFITSEPQLGNFSLLGGIKTHIHFIAHDRIDNFDKLESLIEMSKKRDHSICGEYVLVRGQRPEVIISFLENGKVAREGNQSQDIWLTSGNQILVASSRGSVTDRWIPINGKYTLETDRMVSLKKLQ